MPGPGLRTGLRWERVLGMPSAASGSAGIT